MTTMAIAQLKQQVIDYHLRTLLHTNMYMHINTLRHLTTYYSTHHTSNHHTSNHPASNHHTSNHHTPNYYALTNNFSSKGANHDYNTTTNYNVSK